MIHIRIATVIHLGLSLLLLSGCGTSKPILAEPSLRFPSLSTSVGRDTGNTLVLRNSGEATLTYTVSTSNDMFKLATTTGTVAAQSTGTLRFSATCPDEPATITTTLSVTSDGGNQTIDATLECFEPHNIQLQFLGDNFPPERQDVFEQAAARWADIIVGDLQDVSVGEGDLPATDQICGFQTSEFVGTIDDLLIFAVITPIDGEGQILGQAGPAIVRRSDQSPLIGCMEFDVADIEALEEKGTFAQVILHEMGHVLGYGSLWEPLRLPDGSFFNSRNLLDKPCRSNPDAVSRFNGSNTVVEFGVLGKSGGPEVEDDFGPGTRCSHWDEDTFDNELMTGFLGGSTSATQNPLSALTAASMKDLGYAVDFDQAEPYAIPTCSPDCDDAALNAASVRGPWEVVLQPRAVMDDEGNLEFFKGR
jgi:hypothetical protein